jgi:Peptidase_C39 like family
MGKRVYLITITMVVALMLASTIAYAAPPVSENSVTAAEAENAALQYVARFSSSIMPEWSNAQVSEPVPYYSFIDDTIAAYEFTVLNNGNDVGFIVISARKDWMPALEWGSGEAPSSHMDEAKCVAVENGFSSNDGIMEAKIYYNGALSQSVQFGEKMKNKGNIINLFSGLVEQISKEQNPLQMDKNKANRAWEEISQCTKALSTTSVQSAAAASQKIISGVPAYYQHNQCDVCCDCGHGTVQYPACVGIARDPWEEGDGCAPISGAMVLGYWRTHGYPNISPDDETLIDHGHAKMNTDFYGQTQSWYVASGINLVSNIYSYHFQATSYSPVWWSDIVNEVNANRPFALSVWGHPTYGNHVLCGFGYYYDDWVSSIACYDTFGTSIHYILYLNWSQAMITKVLPAY